MQEAFDDYFPFSDERVRLTVKLECPRLGVISQRFGRRADLLAIELDSVVDFAAKIVFDRLSSYDKRLMSETVPTGRVVIVESVL